MESEIKKESDNKPEVEPGTPDKELFKVKDESFPGGENGSQDEPRTEDHDVLYVPERTDTLLVEGSMTKKEIVPDTEDQNGSTNKKEVKLQTEDQKGSFDKEDVKPQTEDQIRSTNKEEVKLPTEEQKRSEVIADPGMQQSESESSEENESTNEDQDLDGSKDDAEIDKETSVLEHAYPKLENLVKDALAKKLYFYIGYATEEHLIAKAHPLNAVWKKFRWEQKACVYDKLKPTLLDTYHKEELCLNQNTNKFQYIYVKTYERKEPKKVPEELPEKRPEEAPGEAPGE